MTKRYVILIFSLMFVALFYGCGREATEKEAFRFPVRPPHGAPPKDIPPIGYCRTEKMAEDLNLSKAQFDTLRKIEREIIKKRFELMRGKEQKEFVKNRIIEMVRKDSLSKEEILAFMDSLHLREEKLRKEIDDFTAGRLARVHSILDEGQREKLAQKLEEFEPRRRFRPRKDIK